MDLSYKLGGATRVNEIMTMFIIIVSKYTRSRFSLCFEKYILLKKRTSLKMI